MIRTLTKFLVPGVAALALVPAIDAGGRTPGSVLIYPIHRSGTDYFTIVSVTNTNLVPITPINQLGGSTNAHFEYVNTTYSPNPAYPITCQVIDRIEFLTPADTLSVLTTCHNASFNQEGYLVVSAEDPNGFQVAWSHNDLIGSELVVNGVGGIYSLNAIPFDSPEDAGDPTDLDGDGQLDFDGMEYEEIADDLYLDSFFALAGSSLTLINMTGGFNHTANVNFDVWNDNEFPLSATLAFNCWISKPIDQISLVFQGAFLLNNTPNDASELDINCDNVNDIETGWARIRGANASSVTESIPNPALLGALTAGPGPSIDGGHLLWESKATQDNGDFFKTGTDDPEYPPLAIQ
jgi:hypothetical protein